MKGKHTRKSSTLKVVLLLLLTITIIAFVSAGGYFAYQFSKLKTTKIDTSDIGINENSPDNVINKYPKLNKDIVNIALFGIDSRELKKGDVQHSDSIMILSIDKVHKKIKLSSILRDSYVDVPGHGKTKITHAYAYGGPQLALKTLNENFNLNIENYISVDFSGLTDIIDALGGVEINVKKQEIPQINKYAREISEIMHKKFTPVKHPGLQLLNGEQATAYARIRKVGNGDFERTERQKTVLMELAKKIQEEGVSQYPKLISTFLPYTETSLTPGEILSLATECMTNGITQIEWDRFPIDGYCKPLIKDAWYLWIDIPNTTKHIHEFIYEDIKPTPKAPKF